MKDERIEQAINKVRSEMFIIILIGVSVSFFIKILLFNMRLQDCLTEYLILILSPLYQFIRMHMMKVSLYSERGNKQSLKNLLTAIAIFLVVSAMSVFKSRKESAVYVWQNSVSFIIVFIILSVVLYFIANKFNQIKGHKYEKEFDDDSNL
jgi:Na+-translocating ferredoxin:NAD+ oxidoreductase RnfA subunit